MIGRCRKSRGRSLLISLSWNGQKLLRRMIVTLRRFSRDCRNWSSRSMIFRRPTRNPYHWKIIKSMRIKKMINAVDHQQKFLTYYKKQKKYCLTYIFFGISDIIHNTFCGDQNMARDCCFEPFPFASFSSQDDRHVRGFSSKPLPVWRTVYKGLNLEGICKNKKCAAYDKYVWVSLGFGQFHLPKQIKKAPCVQCKSRLKKVQRAGIYKCNILGQGMKAMPDENQTDGQNTDGQNPDCEASTDETETDKEIYFQYESNNSDSFLKFGDLEKQVTMWQYMTLKSIKPQVTCQNKHYLSQFQPVFQDKWTCSKCKKSQEYGNRAKICEECNYKVCYLCLQ